MEVSTNNCCKFTADFAGFPGFCLNKLQQLFSDNSYPIWMIRRNAGILWKEMLILKYMTFNSSCAYAGLANMLERFGIETQDREIALAMGLPYLFAREDGVYCAGPMLQTAAWFHLYLRPMGIRMTETKMDRAVVGGFLQSVSCAMLGIASPSGGRHAVVYTGMKEGRYVFLNNRRQNSPEPENFFLTEEELAARLGDRAVIATIEKAKPQPVELAGCFQRSIGVLLELKEEISAFCGKDRSPRELAEAGNRIFRAIFLDAVTMLELIGEDELGTRLRVFQGQFLDILKEGKTQVPGDKMSIPAAAEAIDDYIGLIKARMKTLTGKNGKTASRA